MRLPKKTPPRGPHAQRKQLRQARVLLILPFVVTALLLAPVALIGKSVTIEGNLTVSQVSFVVGAVPPDVFSGVTTTAFTLHGMDKVRLGNGRLETVETRDPHSGDPLTWRSIGPVESAVLVPADSTTTSVTLRNATLHDLHISPTSRLTLLWLEDEPRLLRLRFDDHAVAGRVGVPAILQFSCGQCRVTHSAGREEGSAEWRFVSDQAQVVDFQGLPDGATLGLELAEQTSLSGVSIPRAEGLDFTRLHGTIQESTIIGDGKITIKDIQQDVTIGPRDFVVLKPVPPFRVRSLSLNNGIQLSFSGEVSALRTGATEAGRNHLPSWLNWFYHQQQTWLLYLNAVILIGTTLVVILERLKVLRGGE